MCRSFACLALAAAAGMTSLACNSSPPPGEYVLRQDGATCASHSECRSGHCDSGYCCASGNCCRTASECPDEFRSASACTFSGSSPSVDCQGVRREARCEGYSCSSEEIADDGGCAGSERDCGSYPAVSCTTAVDQEVACNTDCSGGCADGAGCVGGRCVPDAGVGDHCTGAGQGSCGAGLKCQNDVCCSAASSAACCASDAQCGLCQTCSAEHRCVAVALGQDPRGECAAGACTPGWCSGSGTCAVSAGASCDDGNACTRADVCSGSGSCGGCTCVDSNGSHCVGETWSIPCSEDRTLCGDEYYACELVNGTCTITNGGIPSTCTPCS